MKVVFLGTGGSWPSPKRNVSAIAIKRGKEVILFDCGEGTQRQFMMSSLSFMQVSKIFITHFHGDHFLGLPGLIQSMTLNDREEQLNVYGPKRLGKIMHTLLTLGYFNPSFDVLVEELEHNQSVDFGDYKVTAVRVNHNVPCLGFVLEEGIRPGRFNLEKAKELHIPEGPLYRKLQAGNAIELEDRRITPDMVLGPPRRGRKIAYSGDTLPSDAFVSAAKGADVLIHDATLDSSFEKKANDFGHSSSRQAGEVARRASVGVLFLTHVSPRYEDDSVLEEDARKEFKESYVARDFLEYQVRFRE